MEQEFANLLAAYSLTAVLANKNGNRFDKVFVKDENEIINQRHIDADYVKLVDFVQKHPPLYVSIAKKESTMI